MSTVDPMAGLVMDPMANLSAALRQQTESKAALAGLDEKYTDAVKMRDTRVANPQSIFDYVTDGVMQSRGNRELETIEPQREAARMAATENANAFPLHQAQQALELKAYNETQDAQAQSNTDRVYTTQIDQFNTTTGLAKAKAKAEKAKYDAEQLQRATNATHYTNDESGEKLKVYRNKAGDLIDSESNLISSLKGYSKDATSTVALAQYGYGNESEDKLAGEYFQLMGQANRVGTKVNELPDQARDELNSGKVRFGQWFLNTASPAGLSALIKSEYSGYSAESKSFLESLARMSAEERHSLFGAALTEGEERSGEEFLAFVNGLSLDQIMSRAKDTFSSNREKLLTQDNINGGTKRQQGMNNANWNAFDAPADAEDDTLDAQIKALEAEIAAATGSGG